MNTNINHSSQQEQVKLPSLEKFRTINHTFPKTEQILRYQQEGKKIFGWLCTYSPEEIIHAAGALPIRITGYSNEVDLGDGNAYLYINNCSFSRSCLQMGLTHEYDFLNGVVGGSTCDGARRLFDLWRHYIGTPFHHVLTVPRKYTEAAHALYLREVLEFKQHLEEYLGFTISDDALYKSIELYNRSRKLLWQLYELRKREKPPLTGAQTMEVLNACFHMPKEDFNDLLGSLISELSASTEENTGRARIMLVGSVCTNPDFIKSIEDQGGLVVTDELCTSTRYWGDLVSLDNTSTPVEAIARRYLNNYPCARMFPSDERFDRIIQSAIDFKVDGVISQTVRYCVPYAHDLPLLNKRLQAHNIPMLALDVEYGTAGSGQIQTRVQAFLEMLEGKQK